MDAVHHLDLDIRDPAWADSPADIVRAVVTTSPASISVEAHGAAAQTALAAQLLAFLRRHVEASGGSFAVSAPSEVFVEGLALLGLKDAIIGPEGVQ